MSSEPRLVQTEPATGAGTAIGVRLTIGRHGADLLADHPDASRTHAEVEHGAGGLVVRDLGSRNGTYVNGERIEGDRSLTNGDELRIGGIVWRVELPLAPKPAEPTVSSAAAGPTVVTDAVPAPGAAPSRGDVPAPAPHQPSAVALAPAFSPPGKPQFEDTPSRQRTSAARRLEATVVSYAVVAATSVAVIVYLASR
jgi:predicted component of type VI protein secretion system